MGLRMQPRSEKFFSLFSKAGSNVVECAAILMEFVAAPRERWAELAKRMHDTEHAGDDTTKAVGPGPLAGQPGSGRAAFRTIPPCSPPCAGCSRRSYV